MMVGCFEKATGFEGVIVRKGTDAILVCGESTAVRNVSRCVDFGGMEGFQHCGPKFLWF